MVDVVVEEDAGDGLQGGRDRGDLGENVDAVAVLGDHLLDPPSLTLDAPHPVDERLLVLGGHVPVGPVRSRYGRRSVGHRCSSIGWNRRKRSELVTTKTLENAIAAAATIGLTTPATARGMAAAL